MANNRSDLIKTPVVDRNGKLTTVYKRLVSLVSKKPLPPIKLITLSPSDGDVLTDQEAYEIINYASDNSSIPAHRVRRYTDIIHKHDPTIAEDIEMFQEFGETTAHNEVRHTVSQMLDFMDFQSTKINDGQRSKWFTTRLSHFKSRVVAAWEAGQAADALSTRERQIDPSEIRDHFDRYIEANNPNFENTRGYWRSLALISASTMPTADIKQTTEEDLRWFTMQPDHHRLLKLMRERGTTDVSILKELIKQQESVSAPLHDGLL